VLSTTPTLAWLLDSSRWMTKPRQSLFVVIFVDVLFALVIVVVDGVVAIVAFIDVVVVGIVCCCYYYCYYGCCCR